MESDKRTPSKEHPGTPSGIYFQIPVNILDDLCSRFIINIPEEERQDLIRVFFQIELAHWFYLDFYVQEKSELKSIAIKEFSAQIFKHCPTLSDHAENVDMILGSWREYKMAVPTYGAILLDPSMQYCLLVQGFWAKSSWGFPKGKVNEGEHPHMCAIREVYEETGFDIAPSINSDEFIEFKMNEQTTRLYIVTNVAMDTKFQPRTRKEIKNLEWFRIEYLPAHKKDFICKTHYGLNPNSFFMIIPFVKNLRKWIGRHSTTENWDYGNESLSALSSGSRNRDRVQDKESKVAYLAEKHRQKQNILNNFIKNKDENGKERGVWVTRSGKEVRHKSESPQSAGSKQSKGGIKAGSPDVRKKGKQFQILKRDGTVAGTPSRRSLATEFSNSGKKAGVPELTSPTWTNFKLDVDALLACCP